MAFRRPVVLLGEGRRPSFHATSEDANRVNISKGHNAPPQFVVPHAGQQRKRRRDPPKGRLSEQGTRALQQLSSPGTREVVQGSSSTIC